MKSIGITDARAGSRFTRRCKVQPLLGAPCIGRVIRAAAASRLDHSVIATDDEIAINAADFGVGEQIRLDDLSIREDLQSAEIAQYVLKWLREKQRVTFGIAVDFRRTILFLNIDKINIRLECIGGCDVIGFIYFTRDDQPMYHVFVINGDHLEVPAFDLPFPISSAWVQ